MKLIKGDKVVVIAGKEKGKTGVIQKALPKTEQIIIDGVNLRKKHIKPTQANPEGHIEEFFAPIHVSNAMLVDPKTNKPTRIGYKVEDGKKVRIAKASKSVL